MKMVIDLDGIICPIRASHESYAELLPFPGAAEKIKQLRRAGHYIIYRLPVTWVSSTETWERQ